MADCSKCKFDNDQHCIGCENGSNFEHMSNADKIRSMTDEELAEFLNTLFIEGQIEAIHEQYPDSVFNRKNSSLKWLQQEVED